MFAKVPATTTSLTKRLRLLDRLATTDLVGDLPLDGRSVGQTLGSAIRRLTYHYWFHIGEIQAIRQMLGHRDLPEYVGAIEAQAPYRPAQAD